MMVREDSKPVKVKAELMWACLSKPNQMSGDYQVELTNLSAPAVEALAEIGVEARQRADKPEKGFFITCKSKYPIKAYDVNGDEIHEAVGNGSKAVVVVGPYNWQFKNKRGVSGSIKKLTVTELIEYVAEDSEVDDSEEAL